MNCSVYTLDQSTSAHPLTTPSLALPLEGKGIGGGIFSAKAGFAGVEVVIKIIIDIPWRGNGENGVGLMGGLETLIQR